MCAACWCLAEDGEDGSKVNDQTWGDTDRDYTYDEVSRYFALMTVVVIR